MEGILLVNHFLKGEKYDELHRHLIDSAQKSGIRLTLKTNLELATQKPSCDFVLFWDKDTNLARKIEKCGIPVFNSASAIEKCDDKARTYIELYGTVPQPKTLIAPKTYFDADMSEFILKAIEILGLPIVFKECFGSFGLQVHLCRSYEEIEKHIGDKPFVLQEFVAESAGEDRRLEIVGDKCVSAVKRINKNDFRSNVTNGGEMFAYTPSENELSNALTACKTLGLTFAGVDVLKNGAVCEVNSNAHIINIMNASGVDSAMLIFEEIAKQVK